jgi:hypothetical protein
MHRTLGDGYITDIDGKNLYADEDLPFRDATQLRHQEMNAIQEEICNVIEWDGTPMNPDSETPSQASQLDIAIDAKDQEVYTIVTDETDTKLSLLNSNSIANISNIPGSKVTDALNNINVICNDYKYLSKEITQCCLYLSPLTGQFTLQSAPGYTKSTIGFYRPQTGMIYIDTYASVLPFWKKTLTNALNGFEYFATGANNGSVFDPAIVGISAGLWLKIYAIKVFNNNNTIDYDMISAPISVNGIEVLRSTIRTYYPLCDNDGDICITCIGLCQVVEHPTDAAKYVLKSSASERDIVFFNRYNNLILASTLRSLAAYPTYAPYPCSSAQILEPKIGYLFPCTQSSIVLDCEVHCTADLIPNAPATDYAEFNLQTSSNGWQYLRTGITYSGGGAYHIPLPVIFHSPPKMLNFQLVGSNPVNTPWLALYFQYLKFNDYGSAF